MYSKIKFLLGLILITVTLLGCKKEMDVKYLKPGESETMSSILKGKLKSGKVNRNVRSTLSVCAQIAAYTVRGDVGDLVCMALPEGKVNNKVRIITNLVGGFGASHITEPTGIVGGLIINTSGKALEKFSDKIDPIDLKKYACDYEYVKGDQYCDIVFDSKIKSGNLKLKDDIKRYVEKVQYYNDMVTSLSGYNRKRLERTIRTLEAKIRIEDATLSTKATCECEKISTTTITLPEYSESSSSSEDFEVTSTTETTMLITSSEGSFSSASF